MHNYPVSLSQYFQQLTFQTPAASVSENNWEATVTSRRNTGFWRNNQTYFVNAAFRIQKNKSAGYHGVGAMAYYDKEGIYLKRYRGYLLYSYHLKLSKKYKLSGGLALGLMTYQVGNNEYEGGSGNGLDANLGFMFSGNDFFAGVNIAQLPESNVQPINEITRLTRYYKLIAGKDFTLKKELKLRTNISSRVFSTQKSEMYGQAGVVWNNSLGIYGIYKWKRHASVLVGLEKIELNDFLLKAFFSYDIPVNGESKYQAFEISIVCLKPEKKKK